MSFTLNPELSWTVLTAILTAMLWVPHILQRIIELGTYAAFRDPRHDVPTQAPWAQRAIRAHTNAVENLAVFAVLALAVHVLGIGNHVTATAAAMYFIARVGHYFVYVLGVPWLRTPMFLIGFICQMTLAARLFAMV